MVSIRGLVPWHPTPNDNFPRFLKQILTHFDGSAIRTLARNLSSSTRIISGLQLYESISISINQMIWREGCSISLSTARFQQQ